MATPPALVGAALRVATPSLYWFVATAWYALAARCPDPGAALAVDTRRRRCTVKTARAHRASTAHRSAPPSF